ncbi:MAG: protein kinase [Nannocystaceae bacterium]|nr:protein kinase [Nannocystaceae bacterium]
MNRGTGGAHPAASAGPPPPHLLGEGSSRIGRYELLRRLGAGGMAEVHLARASGFEGFEKLLVLKRILPHLAADGHFVQMFLAEARLAALLQHPNIVQVFDLGKDGTDFFFTMELVYGENAYAISRAARKRREELPIEHAISIIIGAAAGLHYAHERVGMDGKPLGIVHRDVSPTNLMVTYDGCPKVADFGIAKVTNRTDVTQAGIRKGKVPYMSPEQCKAARVDRRSDVFALGICLYELSTGSRLFDGDNEFGVMNRIVTGDIPLPSSRRANYPKPLERILMRALSTDINKRYATCLDMQHELEAYVRETKLDASASSLARWMHRVFKPQPFPWGALQGDGVTGGEGARPTIADSGAGLGSRPGDLVSRPDMTPHSGVGSYPMPSSATSGLMPPSVGPAPSSIGAGTGSGPRTSAGAANDGGTLKGVAMGLGIVAAIAVASVTGLVIYKKTSGGETETETASAQKPVVVEPEPERAVDPAPGADAPPAVPSEIPRGVDASDEAPQAADAPLVEVPEPEPLPEPEEVIELIDEPEPDPEPAPIRPKTSKPKTSKPKTSKPKKKPKGDGGSDPDGFWGN